jgi:hypothetical protein
MELKEFIENNAPKYAILSHTWGAEEISLQEMLAGQGTGNKGYTKIKDCCAQARLDEYDYVWVDTCCTHNWPLYIALVMPKLTGSRY